MPIVAEKIPHGIMIYEEDETSLNVARDTMMEAFRLEVGAENNPLPF